MVKILTFVYSRSSINMLKIRFDLNSLMMKSLIILIPNNLSDFKDCKEIPNMTINSSISNNV